MAVAAWGRFALWKAFEIEEPSAYRPMGPRVFPILISTSLIVFGLLFVVQTLRGTDVAVEERSGELRDADHKQAAFIVGLLVTAGCCSTALGTSRDHPLLPAVTTCSAAASRYTT